MYKTISVRHTGFLQWYPVTKILSAGTKWNTGGSLWASGNTFFFPVSVTDDWQRLPREIVHSPSLEIFKHHSTWLLASGSAWLGLIRGSDQMNSGGPFPPQLFCDSIIKSYMIKKNLWLNKVVCLIKKSNF